MNIFVSFAFNDENRWIEDLAIPLIRSLGFVVVSGRRMEGDIIVEEVKKRIADCRGCVGFTTRRDPMAGGAFSTHQWVLDEMATAHALNLRVVEVREDGVQPGGAANSFVQLRYQGQQRDKLLVELAGVLARWPMRRIRIQLVPPEMDGPEFRRRVLGGSTQCRYVVKTGSTTVSEGDAIVEPITGGFFVDIEVPNEDVLVQLEIKKPVNGSWKSFGSPVKAIPIQLFDA